MTAIDTTALSDAMTRALGGVSARFGIQGLETAERNRMLRRHFPGGTANAGHDPGQRADEFEDLRELLMAHGRNREEGTRWLACAIATACLGENHLWQDMGLPNREMVSLLLRHYFTALYEKNTGNMKWKKFFYKQLCDRSGINACKAPSCQVCGDYTSCFGPEVSDS